MFPDHAIRNINFVGANVRVVMTTITGTSNLMANIYHDVCECTGSFGPSLQQNGYFRYYGFPQSVGNSIISWSNIIWSSGSASLNYATNLGVPPSIFAIVLVDGFTSVTGAYTFTAPYTNLYDVTYRIQFSGGGNHNCTIADFDWQATLYLGTRNLGTIGGTFYDDFCGGGSFPINFSGLFTGTSDNLYLQAGEGINFRIDFNFTNRGDDLDTLLVGGNPLTVSATITSGISTSPFQYRTRFSPHGTNFD